MDAIQIINKYYPAGKLRTLLLAHSESVARKALDIIDRLKRTDMDREFVYEAAMLHDIGIFRCDAKDIYCTGPLPYICHGIEGARILNDEGYPLHALVCERHTGSGITKREIITRKMPLPHRDLLPVSPEERLICYADKFFSKSADNPTVEKPMDRVIESMARFGSDELARFESLRNEFEIEH